MKNIKGVKQISTSTITNGQNIYIVTVALCEDGSIWYKKGEFTEWICINEKD